MAFGNPLQSFSFTSTNDLSADQFRFVDLDAANSTSGVGNVILPTVAGQKAIGVLQNKPTAGQTAEVWILGISKVVAGAAVAAGDLVATDNQGRAVTASTAGAFPAANFILGRALSAASGAGVVISVLLLPGGKQ